MTKLSKLVAVTGVVLAVSLLAGCVTCGPGTYEQNTDGNKQCLPNAPLVQLRCGEGTHEWKTAETEEGRGGERECAPDIRCGTGTSLGEKLPEAEREEGRGVERECVPDK